MNITRLILTSPLASSLMICTTRDPKLQPSITKTVNA